MSKILRYIISIVVSVLFVSGIAYAQINGGVNGPQWFKLSGGAIVPVNSSWTFGNSSTDATFGNLTTGTITVSGTATGDLDMGGYQITDAGAVTATNYVATSTTADTNLHDTLYIDSSASMVGIGVATPNRSLTVLDELGIYGSGAERISFDFGQTAANQSTLSTVASNGWSIRNNHTNAPPIKFELNDGTGLVERMRINGTDGNVGIGTSTPYARLSVVGETVGEKFTATSTTSNNFSGYGGSNTAPTYSFEGDPDTGIYSSSADRIEFTVGATNIMDITNVGFVSTTARWRGAVGLEATPGITFADDIDSGLFSVGSDANIIGFSAGGTEKMRLTTTGLGIGTSTPNQILTIDSGAAATTTAEIGDIYSGTGKTCINVAQADGSVASFYFAAGTMVVETNACK